MAQKKKKNKKWIRFRHSVVRNLLYVFFHPYSRIKYGIKIERFKEQQKRQYLVLMNHQTAFDQFFLGMAIRGPVYYLASEDLFSKGFVSSLINYLVAPIPIKKQTVDVRAILNCMKVAKEGGTIALAPEGNRTYSGRTEYMNPSIATLARKLGMPVALYRIEGGYGVHPRWSDKVRRGKMRGYVARVIYPEEYASMTDEQLFEAIRDGLYVDEACADAEFKSRHLAEYLERALYVCPYCGLTRFESEGDVIECKKCGRRVRYLATKQLRGDGFDFPFEFVADWYEYQKDFVNGLDLSEMTDEPLYQDVTGVYEVIPCEKKVVIDKAATVLLYGDRAEIKTQSGDILIPFDEASTVAVLGKNKLNIYIGDKIYQFKGDKRQNALKYVHFYHRYRNIKKGDKDVKFLGL